MPLGQIFIHKYEGYVFSWSITEIVRELLTPCNLVLRRPFLSSFLQQLHIVLWEKHVNPVVPFHP